MLSLNIIPIIGILLIKISYFPQIIKLLKRKTSGDISLSLWVLVFLGDAFLTIHSYLIGAHYFLANGIIGGTLDLLIMFLIIKYRGKNDRRNNT